MSWSAQSVEHGFKGALDQRSSPRPLFGRQILLAHPGARRIAQAFPIYLHPTQPPQAVVEASFAGFSPDVTFMFANAGWGWHIETAVHVLRMILGGVFDRYPKLQIVVGHMGEALPFMLSRVDIMTPAITGLQRPISAYLRENVHYTFSGFNFTADLPRFIASGRRRSDYVLGRLSLRIDGAGARIPGSTAGERRRPRADRARQRRAPSWTLSAPC